jgi:hypothetical protein
MYTWLKFPTLPSAFNRSLPEVRSDAFWYAIQDKAKPDTGNISGLDMAAVKCTTVQVAKLPL